MEKIFCCKGCVIAIFGEVWVFAKNLDVLRENNIFAKIWMTFAKRI